MFAYVWMNVVLSDNLVEVWEAFLTLSFFFILVVLSYAADRFKEYQMRSKIKNQKLTDSEIEDINKIDEINIKKSKLRGMARRHGDEAMLQVVQGNSNKINS